VIVQTNFVLDIRGKLEITQSAVFFTGGFPFY